MFVFGCCSKNRNFGACVSEQSCPQRSILGPLFWNLILDEYLRLESTDVAKVAYADDCLLIVSAANWPNLEKPCNRTLGELLSWFNSVKLLVSVQKSLVMPIRSKAPDGFAAKYGDSNLNIVYNFKYLGLIIDSKFKFKLHIENLLRTSIGLSCKFAHLGNTLRGYSQEMRRRTYHAVILPKMSYAIGIWKDVLGKSTYVDKLLSTQKAVVKRVALCWRPVDLQTACCLSGILPLNIKLTRLLKTKKCTRSINYFEQFTSTNRITFTDSLNRKSIKSFVRQHYQNVFYSSIRKCRVASFIKTHDEFLAFWNSGFNSTTVQLITGFGYFNDYLKQIKVKDNDVCNLCTSGSQTVDYVLFTSPALDPIRLSTLTHSNL